MVPTKESVETWVWKYPVHGIARAA
jgi:hypothetical protein